MITPNDPKIKNNLPKIKEIIKNDNVILYFVPSSQLKNAIAKGEHPLLKKISKARKIELLSGNGILIQKRMVWDWLKGTLDEKNSFILANGEVRVVDTNITAHQSLIREE